MERIAVEGAAWERQLYSKSIMGTAYSPAEWAGWFLESRVPSRSNTLAAPIDYMYSPTSHPHLGILFAAFVVIDDNDDDVSF